MAIQASKVDVIFKITELLDSGKFEEAMRLQKVFVSSIKNDQKAGQYSKEISQDRISKKALKYLSTE